MCRTNIFFFFISPSIFFVMFSFFSLGEAWHPILHERNQPNCSDSFNSLAPFPCSTIYWIKKLSKTLDSLDRQGLLTSYVSQLRWEQHLQSDHTITIQICIKNYSAFLSMSTSYPSSSSWETLSHSDLKEEKAFFSLLPDVLNGCSRNHNVLWHPDAVQPQWCQINHSHLFSSYETLTS